METENKYTADSQRSEEVNEIVERMPTKFGMWVTMVVGFVVVMTLLFGWLVKYPNVISGQITISAHSAPVKLISSYSGKVQLNIKTFDNVTVGSYIGYIKNPANVEDVLYVKKILSNFDVQNPNQTFRLLLKRKLALGELNTIYFKFLNSLQQNFNYYSGNALAEQATSLKSLNKDQMENESTVADQLAFGKQNLMMQKKIYHRDSVLYSEDVLTQLEFEKSKMNLLSAEQNYRSLLRERITIKESINDSKSQLNQVGIQNVDKENQVKLEFIGAFNDLKENIKAWELKYCFISPINGTVQFLKFLKNDDFVSSGEELFTVIPLNNKPEGQLLMPIAGAGKVKIGQKVIIKLENYPYVEFGSIDGKVENISLISRTLKTSENASAETYLVMVALPNDLKTNYGSKLQFQFELKGSADIITRDERLIERFYDNLKYIVKK